VQVYKPGSVSSEIQKRLAIYLDPDSHQDSIDLPIPHKDEQPFLDRSPKRNLFDLSTHKVYRAPFITVGAVGSYPTFSPLPFDKLGAVCFLWHFLYTDRHQSAPFPLGSMALYVARTFLPDNFKATSRLARCKVRQFCGFSFFRSR
jgi:hypothetical protein